MFKATPTITSSLLRYLTVVLLLLTIIPASSASAGDPLVEADRAATIDFLLEHAISERLISGGVVLIGNHDSVLYSTARGTTGITPAGTPLSTTTLFDIASLTKVIATAPAVMKLLEEERISLLDPLTRWFPELEDTGREEATILNLLTHSSGLSDVAISSTQPMATLLYKAGHQPDTKATGSRFLYADINFILLAELVQRASGIPFDQYCREKLFFPLGMHSTMFLPPRTLHPYIAPTLGSGSTLQTGTVQDQNARLLGGIAGHAGLFSTADDLARFATMLLNHGSSDGKQIFSPRTMTQMTVPYFYNSGNVVRGLGWDIHSPFSSPRGISFSPLSYGHTGYSGSSVWIDPVSDLYVILLTVRTDYHNKRGFNRLRSDISTMAYALFAHPVIPDEASQTGASSDLLKP